MPAVQKPVVAAGVLGIPEVSESQPGEPLTLRLPPNLFSIEISGNCLWTRVSAAPSVSCQPPAGRVRRATSAVRPPVPPARRARICPSRVISRVGTAWTPRRWEVGALSTFT